MKAIRPFLLLLLLLTVVYHSNLRPVASGDSLPNSLVPFAIWLDGTIHLDRFGPRLSENVWYGPKVVRKSGEHWHSVYPVAGPLLATPLYAPLALLPSIRQQPPGTLVAIARIAEKFVAVLLAALSAIALFLLLRRITSNETSWLLTIVFALGTGTWSTSSQALWQHTFGALPIIGCLYDVDRWTSGQRQSHWYWMAGICAGLAIAIRITNLAFLPALGLALWTGRVPWPAFVKVFGPALFACAAAAYNLSVFGRSAGTHPAELPGHWFSGLAGILISPGRGLLVYTPVALFALSAAGPRARSSLAQHKPLAACSAVYALGSLAVVAKWPGWWGGYCWGPRLLTDILGPTVVLIAIGWAAVEHTSLRWVSATAAVYGILIQAIGVYCYPKGRWDASPVSVNKSRDRLWDWRDNPIARTLGGGMYGSRTRSSLPEWGKVPKLPPGSFAS